MTLDEFADNVWMVLKLRGMKPFAGFPFGEGPLTNGASLAAYWRHQIELKSVNGYKADEYDVLSFVEALELVNEIEEETP